MAVSARLVRAEVMKIRTTRAWWLFVGGFTALTALAALLGWASHHTQLYPPSDLTNESAALAQAAADRTPAGAAAMAASMMTSGQALLVLVTMLLGVHVITSEYAARTMTSTFLVTPRRELVIGAKQATAAAFGVGFWAIATVVDGAVTPVFLAVQHLPGAALGSSDVARAVVMGLLAYVLWALFGLGLGAVLRNQAAAAVAAIAIYAGGFAVAELAVHLLNNAFHAPWLLGLAVLAPAEASNVMITSGRAFPGAPPWWAGALVLVGYGVVLAGLGLAVIRRRDVS
jgi:ABC-type transport system involved in multi-copper enzyme maturation permease subunit